MSPHTEKLAVMFAEVGGCAARYDRFGNDIARRLAADGIFMMLDQLAANQGTLIKTVGNGILATFQSAENAMRAACAMQSAAEISGRESDHAPYMCIGFHYGEAQLAADDVSGDAVNVAARVAEMAEANQIVTTAAAINNLPPDLRDKTQPLMRAALAGKQEQFDVFRVLWKPDSPPLARIDSPVRGEPVEDEAELELRYHDQSIKINGQRKRAVLGREDGCDVLVKNKATSRQHARIELRKGKFIIADQSTNGTFIRFADGSSVRLSREDLVLHGSGFIILGKPDAENLSDVVRFSIGAASE